MKTTKFNLSELDALIYALPARATGVYSFETASTVTGQHTPTISKPQTTCGTVKTAAKFAAKCAMLSIKAGADFVQVFCYCNGVFIGTMTMNDETKALHCDFSGWALTSATTETTPETSTPENDTTMKENENNVQEYTHAAQCLDIYVMNESEIYDRYTVPAIEKTARYLPMWERIQKLPAGYVLDGCPTNMHPEDYAAVLSGPALLAAARLVQQHDHMAPTAADIEAVKANYVAYIIECAQYKVANA